MTANHRQTTYSNQIAAALNKAFAAHQVVTKVSLRQNDGLLYVTLEPLDGQSEAALAVKPLLALLRQTLRQAKAELSLGWTKLVKVSGRLPQQVQPLWQEDLLISAAPAIAQKLTQLAPNSPALQQEKPLSDVSINIDGNMSGPLIVGSSNQLYSYTYNVDHGGVLNVAAAPTIRARPTPLALKPPPFTNLLDRQTVLPVIHETLLQGLPVEIYAKPGFGKTALLRHLSHQLELTSRFADGVIYLPALRQAAANLLQSLYDIFYEAIPAFKPSYGQIQQSLKEKAALVILNGLRLDKEEMEWLIAALPKCTFLLVSDERLYWREGTDIALPGLPIEAAIALLQQDLNRPLSEAERTAAESLCAALFGNPLHLRRAAAQIKAQDRVQNASLTTWLASMQAIQRQTAASHSGLAAADLEKLALSQSVFTSTIKTLSPAQKRALALMGAMGEIALTAEQAQAIARFPNTAEILDQLASLQLVNATDAGYQICADLTEAVTQVFDPQPLLQSAADYFAGRASTHNLDAMLHLLDWTQRTGQWQRSLSLVRKLDAPLSMGKRWQQWERMLSHSLQAAQQLGDGRTEAWALHQLGTSAIALGNATQAEYWLSRAIAMRERAKDFAGAAVSRHNLGLLMPPPVSGNDLATGSTGPISRRVSGFVGWAAIAGVVIAGAVGGFIWASDWPRPVSPDVNEAEQKETQLGETGKEGTIFGDLARGDAQESEPGESAAWPALSLDADALVFGEVARGQSSRKTLKITNSGRAALAIGPLKIAEEIADKTADSVDFEVAEQSCTANELLPEQTCVVSVLFSPSETGDRMGQLVIESNARNVYIIPLSGTSTSTSRRAGAEPNPTSAPNPRPAPNQPPTTSPGSTQTPSPVQNPSSAQDQSPDSSQPPVVQTVSLYLQQGLDFKPGGAYTFNLLQSSQAYDPDDNSVEIALVEPIDASGELQNNGDGSVTYFPDSDLPSDQYGEYINSFKFTVVDSTGEETDSVVSITVTIPPPTQEYLLN
ncbi:MAG: choice-of-anchor D domain-containing protein [Phormidesmis sp.]